MSVHIPADVPAQNKATYEDAYSKITNAHGRLLLFAGDQKLEHLHDDFYGEGIAQEDGDPKHMFQIASQAKIGAFATQLGLIAQYGAEFPGVNYIVKLNGKTHLVPTEQRDPISKQLWSMADVVRLKKESGLSISGVGYTLYLGSEFEAEMLHEAAQAVFQAHQHGMIAILWIYPRGKAVKSPKSGKMIAGAAGAGATLGADFVKVTMPDEKDMQESLKWLSVAVEAAGKTKLIISGGSARDSDAFLADAQQMIKAGAGGLAIGRNIHQRTLKDAQAFIERTNEIL